MQALLLHALRRFGALRLAISLDSRAPVSHESPHNRLHYIDTTRFPKRNKS